MIKIKSNWENQLYGDINSLHRVNGEGNGTPMQYSCLKNSMDGGAWKAAVHGVAEGRTRLRDITFTFMHWRRKWQPTPVLLLEKFHGWRSLVGYSPWGRKELDTTEQLHFSFHICGI